MDNQTIFYANVDAVYRLAEHAFRFIQNRDEPTERQKQILELLEQERDAAKYAARKETASC